MPRRVPIRIAILALPILLVSCAAPRATLPEQRPVDLALVVTVFPIDADAAGPTEPAWLRPARYALQADGHLRAEHGMGVTRPGYPWIVRRLEPVEVDRLYELIRRSEGAGEEVFAVDLFVPPTDRRAVLMELGAGGRTRGERHPGEPDTPIAPLLRELARLSWLDR
jgi:hypothetical protein